jgi:hypothetical protein
MSTIGRLRNLCALRGWFKPRGVTTRDRQLKEAAQKAREAQYGTHAWSI